ncbi:putative glycosyltransferase [Nocardia brasiliensis NBRC 14402]|uniref:glycosyltransferase family 4 protein n=1 Tax=Nocardia brasiliensis TaxID=37326 RepID=UPI0002D73872|nr:glycosyltransferase family 4 protein [Nocardia brasiliensis]AVL26345.1 glycosyltransferase family 1 protein [Nocardia brasiliensis]GAJ85583.1 putative glycosyltransferase [Nocardia brasiliensis NBRC 14402]SUB41192.1 D-inositol-3-phosphate glycosyltransferase [Nocardia brasiliensis]
MIRALFLAHTAAPSGAELATMRLLSALSEHTTVEPVMLFTENGPMVRRVRSRGIRTLVLPNGFDGRSLTIEAAGLRKVLVGALALIRLGRRLGTKTRRLDVQVLVAGSTKAMLMGAVAARRARVPLIWSVHDRVSSEYFGRWLAWGIRLLGWAVSDGYLVNSRSTASSLITWRRPVAVVYPGIEPDPTPADRSPQRAPADVVVAMVGRLTPWKGQDVFLRALAEVKVPPRQVFLIGGTLFDEEPYRRELERSARALRLPVTFTGHVDDPRNHLRQADILVHCSVLAEPFGQVVVEGLQAGCAVIASRPGGPAEIIEPGVNGVLVEGGDAAQLTSALDLLMTDPALRTKLAEAGVLRAREFDIVESAHVAADFLTAVTKACHG